MIVGKKISQLRKQKNMTQKELADMLSVTDKAISRWESGVGNPDLNTLPKIAKIFGVSTDYLLSNNECLNHDEIVKNKDNIPQTKRYIPKKRIFIIALSFLAILTIALGIVFGANVIVNNKRNYRLYQEGINYLESGKYNESKEIFESINYSDSKNKASIATGMLKLKEAKETKHANCLNQGIELIIQGNCKIDTFYEGNGKNIIENKTRYEEFLDEKNYTLISPQTSDFDKWVVQSFYFYQDISYLYLSAVWK